jgi:hypothetical protein
MTEAFTSKLVAVASDRVAPTADRLHALRELMSLDVAAGKHILLGIASDDEESDEMLAVVGEWLARLADANAVSEFDIRDMTARAAATFFDDDR